MNYQELYNKGYNKLKQEGLVINRESGAETSSSIIKDREYLDSISFEMRLIGSQKSNPEVSFFNNETKTPIMPGAMSGMKSLTDKPLIEIAKGVKKAGSIMWVGISSEHELKEVINTGVPTVKIVKPYKDDKKIISKLKSAEKLGAIAVGIDIDFFFGGKRKENLILPKAMAPRSVQQLKNFREETVLPFIVKGVLSIHDALKAVKIGADAIVVSNHGEAVLDHVISPLKILPSIVKATSGEIDVLIDSGFKRGTDVLKALALGAKGVLIGKQIVLGLAADQENGVYEIINILTEELSRAMSITGSKKINSIDLTILHFNN